MGLITQTQEAYYNRTQTFTGDGSDRTFDLLTSSFTTLPTAATQFQIAVNGKLINKPKSRNEALEILKELNITLIFEAKFKLTLIP